MQRDRSPEVDCKYKSYRLLHDIPAIGNTEGKRFAITLSKGAVIRIASKQNNGEPRMLNVECGKDLLAVSELDIQERGEEIPDSQVSVYRRWNQRRRCYRQSDDIDPNDHLLRSRHARRKLGERNARREQTGRG